MKRNHTRSIFKFEDDEVIFQEVYSDLIQRVSHRLRVSKNDIMDKLNDYRLIPILERLKSFYNETDVFFKINNKVRTLGISRRGAIPIK